MSNSLPNYKCCTHINRCDPESSCPSPVFLVPIQKFNDDHDQQEYSRARFNANANRRVAYRQTLAIEQRRLHMDPTFGAFMAEKILGCPSTFATIEDTRDFMEDHVYGTSTG